MAVVRMKDIARELGVSVVTVSKALRNHEDISLETRGKVLQLMRDMNYRPNLAARALVTGRSLIVGCVVPGLMHSFFGEIAKGLTNVFRKKGYGLVLATSEEEPELEQQEIEQLLARHVDALIVATTQNDRVSIDRIEEQGVPYVLIDRKVAGVKANFVGVDDETVGHMATEHLIQVGCRRIAYLLANQLSPSQGRLEGYKQTLAKYNLPSCSRVVGDTGDAVVDVAAYATMKELLAQPNRPDGVFAFNDQFAVSAMKAVLDSGLRIPEDVAFVGCGNIQHADFLRVPLTTVDQNSVAIGEMAAKVALGLIDAQEAEEAKNVLLEPRLLVRQSSMRRPV
ncbi:MAG: LacI family transcriptional regulator [Acidobacteriia bacterium]|nr:LacI family transcriptional regulator [Terriglobia bacterium]